MKKIILTVCALLIIALCLCACGKMDNVSDSSGGVISSENSDKNNLVNDVSEAVDDMLGGTDNDNNNNNTDNTDNNSVIDESNNTESQSDVFM